MITLLFLASVVSAVLLAAWLGINVYVNRKLPNAWVLSGVGCFWLAVFLVWVVEPKVYPIDLVAIAVILSSAGVFLIKKGADIARPDDERRLRQVTDDLKQKIIERRREKLRRQ